MPGIRRQTTPSRSSDKSWLRLVLLFAVPLLHGQSTADAVEAFHKGQYAQARQMLEKIAAASPNDGATQNGVARTFLGLSRAATGDCDAARGDLQQQFNTNPEAGLRRLAGIALVQCDLSQNRLPEALPVLDKLQKSFPDDADVLYETARVHMKAWNDAVFQMYQKAPASYRVNQLSGEIFEIQGRFQDAAAEYRKAIQKNPAALNLHFRLGRALLLESHDAANLREARKQFEAELALNPGDAVAEYQVGQTLLADQNAAGAAAHFDKAVSLNPEFPEALVALAKTRSDARKYGEAIGLLERAVKLQPASESAHYSLMLAYRNAGRAAEAQREKAIFDKLNRPPEGEFTEFLKRLGDKAPKQ
ncbi:MAG TPA: tetratricopeptide repeat protein [Candidatus Acidoferrales bacterium]|nr:tetratricopeptide repeat protein [Candidatus Acidoferrales bacterium]